MLVAVFWGLILIHFFLLIICFETKWWTVDDFECSVVCTSFGYLMLEVLCTHCSSTIIDVWTECCESPQVLFVC